MLQVGHIDPLKVASDFLEIQGCILDTLFLQNVLCLCNGPVGLN